MKKIFNKSLQRGNIDGALLLARVGIALMMLTHGIPKMIQLFFGKPIEFVSVFGLGSELSLALAVFAEVLCSILILVGFATRLAVVPLIITMLVAVFYVHGADPFAMKEMGLHYLLAYVFLLLTGSGKYSIDGIMDKRQYKLAELKSI